MSRKIDALVAENVMGWQRATDRHGVEAWCERKELDDGTFIMIAMYTVDRWIPSTDIASAWEVVEKFNGTRYTIVVTAWGSNTYTASLWDGEKCRELDSGNRDSAPLSICLVALRAVGVPESDIEAARNQTKGPQ